jgi:hypothetical protein
MGIGIWKTVQQMTSRSLKMRFFLTNVSVVDGNEGKYLLY